MEQINLQGSVRAALSFVAGHVPGLIKASLWPFVAMLALTFLQMQVEQHQFQAVIDTNAAAFNFGTDAWSLAGLVLELAVTLVSFWLFVRIVQVHAGRANPGLGLARGEAKNAGMSALYALAIYLPIVLVIGGMLVLTALVLGLTEDPESLKNLSGPALAVLLLFFVSGFVIFFALSARFSVALVDVGLGARPRIYRGIWHLTENIGAGLPWRLFGLALLMLVIVSVVFTPLTAARTPASVLALTKESSAVEVAKAQIEWLQALWPLQLAYLPVGIALNWVITVFVAEVYQRARAARPQPPAK